MLGMIFQFCNIKIIFDLIKINKKFKRILTSKEDIPLFSDFLEEIKISRII
jgi:hypothetical protein